MVSWDRGTYINALDRLERLLTGPRAEQYLERAALLTGELFVTTEIAPDGREVRWSPGGNYVAWEIQRSTPSPTIACERLAGRPSRAARVTVERTIVARFDAAGGLTRVADVPGSSLVFAPGDGFASYVTAEGVIRELTLASGAERVVPAGALQARSLFYRHDGTLLASATTPEDSVRQIYAVGPAGPQALTSGPGTKNIVAAPPGLLVFEGGGRITVQAPTGTLWQGGGRMPSLSADGRMLTFVSPDSAAVFVLPLMAGSAPRRVAGSAAGRSARPVLSPDGARVAWQSMAREDWEIFLAPADSGAAVRLSHEIQHDIFPQFVAGNQVLEVLGEGRHRRSYLIDIESRERRRLFHNNSVRTISSEYQWVVSPDRGRVLIVADRDGNTVSPERGVYLVDLSRRVTVADVLDRVRTAREVERGLRLRGELAFLPFNPRVRSAVGEVSVERIDRYAHDIARFDSRFVTRPGNAAMINYVAERLRSWGFEPELQGFEPCAGMRTANVIATLRGTVDPDVTVVIGTHLDSVEPGPGADDNGSGSTALLEAARVLASRPQRNTIKFVWFTGEEGGLLGATEFTRRAVADSLRVVAALNNDMVGWMNDHRLDNTIRYTNDGLRDIQHAAAFLFTNLITYDSRYYQSTDAHPMNDAWGDVVAGIGSYPVLGNPHYHQSHDVLETIDQHLVAEVSKTTVASLILMASSPSRVRGLGVTWNGASATATWQRPPERGVTGYRVRYGPPENPEARSLQIRSLQAVLPGALPGWHVAVKAQLPGGVEGWDWARLVIPDR